MGYLLMDFLFIADTGLIELMCVVQLKLHYTKQYSLYPL